VELYLRSPRMSSWLGFSQAQGQLYLHLLPLLHDMIGSHASTFCLHPTYRWYEFQQLIAYGLLVLPKYMRTKTKTCPAEREVLQNATRKTVLVDLQERARTV